MEKDNKKVLECCGKKHCPRAVVDLEKGIIIITDDYGGSVKFDSMYQLRSLVLQLNNTLPFK